MYAKERTPMKRSPTKRLSAEHQTQAESNSPTISQATGDNATQSKVRTSIDIWESGEVTNLSPVMQPLNTQSELTGQPKAGPSAKPTVAAAKKGSKQGSQPIEKETSLSTTPSTPMTRAAKAKALITKGKIHLNESRNIKTEIKNGLIATLDGLYKLYKEAEECRMAQSTMSGSPKKDVVDLQQSKPTTEVSGMLLAKMDEQAKSLREIGSLRKLIVEDVLGCLNRVPQAALNVKLEDINRNVIDNQKLLVEVRGQIGDIEREIQNKKPDPRTTGPHHKEENATYANMTARGVRSPVHSIVVSSEGDDSSDEIIKKIRSAVDAKSSGIRVDRLRRAREQKVILGCSEKQELTKVTNILKNSDTNFKLEEIRNKDPLVVLRDLLAYNSDEDIVKALKNQNSRLLEGISEEEYRVIFRYRKRSRNQHECHAVLQVSPQVWQRLTSAGKVHIDLQRVQVKDESPVIQCTRCLAFGHGRKYCTKQESICCYCGDLHMASDCPVRAIADAPTCPNCVRAKHDKVDHSAFDRECPVRKKWDALARSAVAYC